MLAYFTIKKSKGVVIYDKNKNKWHFIPKFFALKNIAQKYIEQPRQNDSKGFKKL